MSHEFECHLSGLLNMTQLKLSMKDSSVNVRFLRIGTNYDSLNSATLVQMICLFALATVMIST